MGIDKSLSDRYPSVVINGSRYHYGKTPEYGSYLVENAAIAKDYWSFKEEVDLKAFLINLPQSADRNLRLKLHPDWRDVTPEQRDVYFEQDKLLFRTWAEEKISNGTAHSYDMDLEGKHGPHQPQQIPKPATKENPVHGIERKLREEGLPGGLSEAGKLRVIEGEIDWEGVDTKDKERILFREVDFKRITPQQFDFVYADISHDKYRPADATVARKLFDAAHDPKLPSDRRADFTDPGYGQALEAEANRARSKFPAKAATRSVTPVEKAEIEIQAIKGRENNRTLAQTDDLGLGDGWTVIGTVDLGKWADWNEPQRLAVLGEMVPWEGVDQEDKRRLIEREIDLSRVSPGDQQLILGEVWNQNDVVSVRDAQLKDAESPVVTERPPEFGKKMGDAAVPRTDFFHSDEPSGVYQVWHKRGDGYAHVADVDCGNLLAALVSTRDGYPGLEHLVRPVEGRSRSTDFGDRIIDPNGMGYEVAKEGGMIFFKAIGTGREIGNAPSDYQKALGVAAERGGNRDKGKEGPER